MQVRVVLCNNGQSWAADAQNRIDQSGLQSSGQVAFEHFNHRRLLELMKKPIEIEETVRFLGTALVDQFNYRRVLIGKVGVRDIQELVEKHSDLLFEKNIRRYLGWSNRVNLAMQETLLNENERQNFYFYNNGITMICNKFSWNALQTQNWSVKIKGMQIINGGQTCRTIHHLLSQRPGDDFSHACVLVRLYELDDANEALAYRITGATNSQSPIELRDLRSNDAEQVAITHDIELLGYEYKSKRDSVGSGSTIIPSTVAAEAVLAIWRRKPHQAKYATSKLFDQFYKEVFSNNLTGAQVILAVLIYRAVHNERRKPTRGTPFFLPYASHHLAMIVGQLLLNSLRMRADQISHLNFASTLEKWQAEHNAFYDQSVGMVRNALSNLAVNDQTGLQRVAAQFRRGDLLELLNTEIARQQAASVSPPAPKAGAS